MEVSKIVSLVNKRLAGERLVYAELEHHLDDAMDQINARLSATFPVFSEFVSGVAGYPNFNFIPDRYIRTVVVPYVLAAFYTTDEEGASGAADFKMEFIQNLFYMERDYLSQVPLIYQADTTAGILGKSDLDEDRGLEFDGFFE